MKRFSPSWGCLPLVMALLIAGHSDLWAHASLASGDRNMTGSPLDARTCSSCHSATSTTNQSPNLTFTGLTGTTYTPGTTYSLTLSLSTTGTGKNGFEITAETTAAKVGTFTAGTNSLRVNNLTSCLGQSGASSAIKSWTFSYTAPAAGTGRFCFYMIGLPNSSSQRSAYYLNNYCFDEAAGTPAPTITTQPAPQTVNDGQTATFSLAASGTGLTYQWQKAPSGSTTFAAISGATALSYTTPALTLTDSGSTFKCIVTNAGGSVTSSAATLTVNAIAPTITGQPAAKTVNEGAPATFSISAIGGSAPISYQWQKAPSGSSTYSNIAGATSASYTTPATVLADSGSNFRCVVTNTGGSATSAAALLTVNPAPPAITTQPLPQSVVAGQAATFSVTASGSLPLSYQWQSAPSGSSSYTAITGATSASYTTPATAIGDNGVTFRCVVTNGSGSATSSAVTLTVSASATPPGITTQPTPQSILVGQTAVFSVTATGTAPLGYQWQKAPSGSATFTNISGATAMSYITPAAVLGDSGSQYRCVVTNAQGSATSNPATLSVGAVLPSITAQPSPQSILVGQTAVFSVAATGTAPLGYQWQKAPSGSTTFTNISGATAASYATPAAVTGDNGSRFQCVVSNSAGTVTSNPATLTVGLVAPAITVQPTPQTVMEGQTATFSLTATGTSLAYQWQRAPAGSSTYVFIPGATGAGYTTPATVQATDSGAAFQCVVSNSAGTVTSNPATLTVNTAPVTSAPSIVTQPVDVRAPRGQPATFSVVAANPGDPTLNYLWYRDGQPIRIDALGDAYTLPAVSDADNGARFSCLLSNSFGSITSNEARLYISQAMPAPVIGNLRSIMSLSDTLRIQNQYTVPVSYSWTFTRTGPVSSAPASGSAVSAAGATAPAATTVSASNTLSPSALNLDPGQYQISVQAISTFGDASPVTTARATFLISDMNQARVYPDPWRSDRALNPYMTFDALPVNSTIKIFTVAGRLVKSLDAPAGSAQWHLTNDAGDPVASGLYLYLITDDHGGKKRGKLAIIR